MADKERLINSDYAHRMAEWAKLSKDDDAVAVANYMASHQLEGAVQSLGPLSVEQNKLLLEWATELLSQMKDAGWRKAP